MQMATALFSSMFPSSAAATTAATTAASTAGATAAATTSGLSLSTLLQGTATVLGMTSAIAAGQADAEAAKMQADDTARQVPLETLQGIKRRSSIKQEMMDQLGSQDTAFAGAGVDLSFGTPGQARREAFRQADLGLTADVGTEQTNIARLQEREAAYRKRAGRAKLGGYFDALTLGFNSAASIAGRG